MRKKSTLSLAISLLLLGVLQPPVSVEVIGDSFANRVHWFLANRAAFFDPGELVGYNPGKTCVGIRDTEFDTEFDPSVDLLVLQCGTNDATQWNRIDLDDTEAALRSMRDAALAAGAQVVLSAPPELVPPHEQLEIKNPRLHELRARMQAMAGEDARVYVADGLAAFLRHEAWGVPAGEPGSLYAEDGVHPSLLGRDVLGREIAQTLQLAVWSCEGPKVEELPAD